MGRGGALHCKNLKRFGAKLYHSIITLKYCEKQFNVQCTMGRGALQWNNVKRFGANTVKSSAIGSVQWAGGHCIATMLKDLVQIL